MQEAKLNLPASIEYCKESIRKALEDMDMAELASSTKNLAALLVRQASEQEAKAVDDLVRVLVDTGMQDARQALIGRDIKGKLIVEITLDADDENAESLISVTSIKKPAKARTSNGKGSGRGGGRNTYTLPNGQAFAGAAAFLANVEDQVLPLVDIESPGGEKIIHNLGRYQMYLDAADDTTKSKLRAQMGHMAKGVMDGAALEGITITK